MLLSELSVSQFLRLPFGTLSDGGYTGLVFLVARSADAPDLHEKFFREWSDIHDLTGRYLAVITPDPWASILLHEELYRTQYGNVVQNVACFGDQERLSASARGWRSSVQMASPRSEGHTLVAPARTHGVREHQDALNNSVGAMQEFFGISESLLPCAVIVSLQEQTAFVITLDEKAGVYQLLKQIKIEIEPMITQIRKKEAELAAAKQARRDYRGSHDWGRLHEKVRTVQQMWAAHRTNLADDVFETALEQAPGELADLCWWMRDRLLRDGPLTGEEWASTCRLLDLLRSAGTYGRLPKRLRRTLAKLDAGYPREHETAVRLAAAEAGEESIQCRIGRVKAELDGLGRELRLGAAVVAAAGELGMVPAGSHGLLPWRELRWPISVLARPKRTVPIVRSRRA